MNSHRKYFESRLRELPIERLWTIIGELLLPCHPVPDKTGMMYEQVLELCIALKEADEMFKNLEQIALIKEEMDKSGSP